MDAAELESLPTWQQIAEVQLLLDLSLREAKERGARMVAAEAAYYGAKARRVYDLTEAGMSATAISMVIKGDPEVAPAMSAYHAAQVEYENAKEARNVYKKKLDTLREQYQREWREV